MRFLLWLLARSIERDRRVVVVAAPGSSSMRCEECEFTEAVLIAKALFDRDCEAVEVDLEEMWTRPTFIDQDSTEFRPW